MRYRSDGRSGLTLIELVVVAALTAGLLVMISSLYLRGRDAMRQSTERLETSSRVRSVIDALTPLVLSAVRTGGNEPLTVLDTDLDDITNDCRLRISTREDYLAGSYLPEAPFRPTLAPPAVRLEARYTAATKELVLHQLRLDNDELMADMGPRLLGSKLSGCGFVPLSPYSVGVTLESIADRPDPRRPDGVTKVTIHGILTAASQQ